jgi:cysteine-rich repeat protein
MKAMLALLAVPALLLPSLSYGGPLFVGPEFQVNTYTTFVQSLPAVAVGAGGRFVIVWESYQDGDGGGIFGQFYDANGMAVGSELQLNTYTTDDQRLPQAAADADGNFIVTWTGLDSHDGDDSGIFARRFDGTGAPLSSEFQVNTYTTNDQILSDVAVDGSGNSVFVWSGQGDGDGIGAFGRRYDSAGNPLGNEFQVNTYTTGTQSLAGVAAAADGRFIVAWSSEGQDGDGRGVFGQRYDNNGMAVGDEFQVNTFTTGHQEPTLYLQRVAMDDAGNFVLVWTSVGGADGDGRGAFGRRYDASGAALGGEFQVNTYTTGSQYSTGVAAVPGGGFVALVAEVDGSGAGGFARRYDASGTPLEAEFQVNTYTTFEQVALDIAHDAAGNFVVAMVDTGERDGDQHGIFAQRLASPRVVLGKKIIVKDPTGIEDVRATIGLGKETGSDIGPIAGNPVLNGATLRVIANGMTPSDETYALDASGWTPTPTGFKYQGPTGGDGDPVKKIVLKSTPDGTALLKAIIKGNFGTQPLEVFPPNPGTNGTLLLTINGGGATYCVSFGGAAGGIVAANAPSLWKITNATGQGCLCGDGIVEAGERCDDANVTNTDTCTNTCDEATCGDGFLQSGETCDDANRDNTDTCTNACLPPACGDGFAQPGNLEECDDGNADDTDDCLNACLTPLCGDGVVWSGHETCDDGNFLDTDTCTSFCLPATCGDGFIWTGMEDCDDGNVLDGDGCSSACLNEP